MNTSTEKPILVVGAGIAGITATLEAAEAGFNVVLVERDPSIGGRVLKNHNYFPKLCPPACGMEINTRRLERNQRIRVVANAGIKKADRKDSGWSVTLVTGPAFVNSRCTACGKCSAVCPAKVRDPFNLGMRDAPAIRLPNQGAWPNIYTMNREACPSGCRKCVEACKYDAIDLEAKETEEAIEVSSVILATGWRPYPLEKLTELGGGAFKNVIANVNMERMASENGPTGGKIVRPSDGRQPGKVAFVQCAGSRDVNHLPYCSAVCCLASLKQAIYVREQIPDSEVEIYYIDRRAPGRNEDMLVRVAKMQGVKLIKGKVAKISEDAGGTLKLKLEDVEAGRIVEAEADLVVLATGMVSNLKDAHLPFGVKTDDDGFALEDAETGVFIAGVAGKPEDVAASTRHSTGAAAKSIIAARRKA